MKRLAHRRLDQEHVHERESAVERLHLRWSSSSRVIADRPPSQPLNRRQMSGKPISCSVKESHKDPSVGDTHRRRNMSGEAPQERFKVGFQFRGDHRQTTIATA
jgi:hypothetical protein